MEPLHLSLNSAKGILSYPSPLRPFLESQVCVPVLEMRAVSVSAFLSLLLLLGNSALGFESIAAIFLSLQPWKYSASQCPSPPFLLTWLLFKNSRMVEDCEYCCFLGFYHHKSPPPLFFEREGGI